MQKLEKSNKVNDYNVLSLFPLAEEGFKNFKVCFSEHYKGSCMTVETNRA